MQITIKCPNCNSDSSFFVAKDIFQGPFRCWKCKSLYTARVEKGEVKKLDPLSQEDFDKAKAAQEAKKKKAKEKTA